VAKNNGIFLQGAPCDHRTGARFQKRRARIVRRSCSYTADSCRGTGNSAYLGLSERIDSGSLGTDHRKCKQYTLKQYCEAGYKGLGRFKTKRDTARHIRKVLKLFARDTKADAVVEATILFPVMTMVFAALVLLAVYLPAQSVLQRATQYAATAIATEISDTWLFYDESTMSYYREKDKNKLKNVYADMFSSAADIRVKGEDITINIESSGVSSKAGRLTVECTDDSNILYREIIITASREYPVPVDLSFIGFPDTITVTAASTVVALNAEEFVRTIDIASDFTGFIIDRYDLHDVEDSIGSFGRRVSPLLGH